MRALILAFVAGFAAAASTPAAPLMLPPAAIEVDAAAPVDLVSGGCGWSPVVADISVAGGTERVLFLGTERARALLVLLPGNDGIVALDSAGGIHQLGGNFLVRTMGQWLEQGFDVVLPAYAEAIGRAIDFGRSHANLPVWLIATSQGSTAAVNGAAHLGSRVSGAVLASSVTRPGHAGETLFDTEPGAISVPVLVVVNQYDSCGVSPPADAPSILAALTRAPRKELAVVASNQIARRADRCEGMSPHGYLGIEAMVVQRISDWIRMAGGR